MLDFNALLQLAGIDPSEVLIVRHVPQEKDLRQVLPWLVAERPDLWLTYQSVQWETLEKAMTKGKYVASFIGQDRGEATFAGFYRIGAWKSVTSAAYRALPGNQELMDLGMTGRSDDMPDCLLFDLEELEHFSDWIGKLTIAWPKPYQQWWRWGGRGVFKVETIEAESRFVKAMPDWQDITLSWNELQCLPGSWQKSLAEWRGIYFIYDAKREAGYVGSAAGTDNLLGRWRDYARSGHGGNRELRSSDPADLRFSILQRTSPDMDMRDIVALEASWKKRLHTREFGLNAN